VRFRLTVLIIDLVIIAFFIASPLLQSHRAVFYVIDYLVAAILFADIAARAYAH